MVGEIPATTFLNYFIYLFIPFAFGLAARRINISPIIGYIIGGIVLGNLFQGLISPQIINDFAYFGIILLLFTIGLEVNLSKLATLKRFIVIGGLLQIFLTLISVTTIASFFNFTLLQSFLIGIALTSSSTSIVAKIIQEQGEEDSFLGEIALGILMFQDLAFIPFIIIFTYFHTRTPSYVEVAKNIGLGIAQAGIILFLMYYLGRKVVPVIFNKIARISRELLNLFIIVFIFLITALSSFSGVPILVGSFIAGILVSQTLQHYHIFSQIRPLRDLMAIIFFVFIGSHVKLGEIFFSLPNILLFAGLIIIVKALILLIVFLYFRFSSRMAFSLAIFLFQVSENAFILLSVALVNGIFTPNQYLFVLSAVLVSMMLTPILISNKDHLYNGLRGLLKKYVPPLELFIRHRIDFDETPLDVFSIKNHVVICGYGRIGSYVGRALTLANIPFIAIDYNFHSVERMKKEGINIIYGDPTDIDLLDYAETEHALALVSAVPGKLDQEAIILNAKQLNPEIYIISRVHTDEDLQRLKDLGVSSVVQPETEASLTIIKKIFLLKRMPKDEILRLVKHLKLIRAAS